jgi:hypothetical protein
MDFCDQRVATTPYSRQGTEMNKLAWKGAMAILGCGMMMAAMAQTTPAETARPRKATPPPAASESKSNREIQDAYRSAMAACQSLTRRAKTECINQAHIQRSLARSQVRNARLAKPSPNAIEHVSK